MQRSIRSLRSISSVSHCAAGLHLLSELTTELNRNTVPTVAVFAKAPVYGQRRPFTAFPQQAIVNDELQYERGSPTTPSERPAPQLDPSHARRLAELERASRFRTRQLPTASEVAKHLRPRDGSGCSSGAFISRSLPSPEASEEHPLSWRDIIAALRKNQRQPVDRGNMLTDTFRCGEQHLSTFRAAYWGQTPSLLYLPSRIPPEGACKRYPSALRRGTLRI